MDKIKTIARYEIVDCKMYKKLALIQNNGSSDFELKRRIQLASCVQRLHLILYRWVQL